MIVPRVSGNGVRLRGLALTDVDDLVAGYADPVLQRFMPPLPVPFTPAQAREYVSDVAPGMFADGGGLWAIADPATDRLLGGIGLDKVVPHRGQCEVGYWVGPWARGRGVAVAAYFGYFAAKVHPDVRVLDDGGTLLLDRVDQARAAGATAMLAIVLPRYPRETLEAVREARGAGLAVVALTDSAVSPVAAEADVVLPAPVGTQLVFDLHTGPMAMAMVLLQAMCDAAPELAQRRLEEFEATASRRHLFEA